MSSYLVTGASRGLGFEFLRQLSADANNIVIGVVRNAEATKQKVDAELQRKNIHVLQADLDDFDAIKTAVNAASEITGGSIDYVIANAAFISTWSSYDGISVLGEKPKRLEQDLFDSFRTNVVGNVHLFNLALPLIQRGLAKKVITVSSGMADLDFISKSGIEVGAPYSISKAALNTAVAKFSAEHSHQGILFFSISPGVIDTGLYDNATEEEKQKGMAMLGKMAKYAPHFAGPTTTESSVKDMLFFNYQIYVTGENVSMATSASDNRDLNKQVSTSTELEQWTTASDGFSETPSPCAPLSPQRPGLSKQRFQDEDVCEAQQDSQTRRSVLFLWIWEILSLVLATCLLAVTITVILGQDDHPLRDWPLDRIITLNSLVNLLSTIFRGILVSIATELIAQAKWTWFWCDKSSQRRMGNLQHFDDGTRGVWGALKLMRIVTWRSPSILVAVVVLVSSFAVGPFVQQSIGHVDKNETLGPGTGMIPVTRHVDGLNIRTLIGDNEGMALRSDIKGAIQTLALSRNGSDSVVVPTCPTGNCTFIGLGSNTSVKAGLNVTHASAGICNICTDIREMIDHRGLIDNLQAINHSLANGISIINTDREGGMRVISGDLSWTNGTIPLEALERASVSFVNVTVLTSTALDGNINVNKPKHAIAITCSLYPCIRTYSAIISRGVLSETPITKTPMSYDIRDKKSTGPKQAWDLSAVQLPCLVKGKVYTEGNLSQGADPSMVRHVNAGRASEIGSAFQAPEECIYRIDNNFKLLMSQYFSEEFFNGTCSWVSTQPNSINCGSAIWLSRLWSHGESTPASLKQLFTDFATALTNQMRFGMGRKDNTTSVVNGESLQLVTFIAVKPYWLIFPAILLIIEIMALSWMISLTVVYRDELAVWKGSILPLLFYRDSFWGNADRDSASKRLLTTEEMEEQADQIRANFSRNIWKK
ncbi:short-chain dehydrogenase [Colletotrichum costaricense]|uniref:Short-chain dehydrogenase n=1 Tax=Colletotrichum costaricense TaxID=1209916 RepID=A0AAI9YZH8_9PEZI|nr:short-chain dehydrogenase [Colletotrichum costaricense]KAK1529090.1 short-chain dehydrogenase [Colletotrichum costaricense]